jgi:hypothetical protein
VIAAFVHGIGLLGPGLVGWADTLPVLTGARVWSAAPLRLAPPSILAANERRRTGDAVRLALNVAQQASEMADVVPGAIPSLFATANGDGQVMHAILETLASDAPVSPTQFHNSVHNAAAGYWSIATGSHQPASCLAGHDSTAAAALLKAMASVHVERQPILLCVYDVPMPEPLAAKQPTDVALAIAMILAPEPGPRALGEIAIAWHPAPVAWPDEAPLSTGLWNLARGNPAGRLLRLLEALARGHEDQFALALLDARVKVSVRPCSTAARSSR